MTRCGVSRTQEILDKLDKATGGWAGPPSRYRRFRVERATEADSSGEEWPPDWWPVLAVAFRDSYDADRSGAVCPASRPL